MKLRLHQNADVLAGLLFLTIGGIAMYVGKDFPLGTAVRMGPGYFPRVLSLILIAFGVFVLLRGLRKGGPDVPGRWGWRPLFFVTLSIIAFGYLMPIAGMVPALVVMFFIAAFGGHEFKFLEVLILSVLLSALAAAVFVYGLGLPYSLFGGH